MLELALLDIINTIINTIMNRPKYYLYYYLIMVAIENKIFKSLAVLFLVMVLTIGMKRGFN